VSAGPHPTEDRLIDLAGQLLSPPVEDDTLRHLESCGPCEERFRSICRDAELAVDLPRPRTRDHLTSPEFTRLKRRSLDLLLPSGN